MSQEICCPYKIAKQLISNAPECDFCDKWVTCASRAQELKGKTQEDQQMESKRKVYWINGRTLPFFRGNMH